MTFVKRISNSTNYMVKGIVNSYGKSLMNFRIFFYLICITTNSNTPSYIQAMHRLNEIKIKFICLLHGFLTNSFTEIFIINSNFKNT